MLLSPPAVGQETRALPASNVHRYRISWRAKSLDNWLLPSSGLFHASDTPIWWLSGYRCDWSDDDKRKAQEFLRPFGEFLHGRTVPWGRANGSAEDRLRLLDEDGVTHEDVLDKDWQRCMRVADVVWGAQRDAAMADQKGEAKL